LRKRLVIEVKFKDAEEFRKFNSYKDVVKFLHSRSMLKDKGLINYRRCAARFTKLATGKRINWLTNKSLVESLHLLDKLELRTGWVLS